MAYGKKMMNQPELKKMRECGKMAAGMLPKCPLRHLKKGKILTSVMNFNWQETNEDATPLEYCSLWDPVDSVE